MTYKEKEKLLKVLLGPHMSEKALLKASKGKYVFKVSKKAIKKEIKKAVKLLFGKRVDSVRVVNIPKNKKIGRYKKAYVKLLKGESIEELNLNG
ncbi:50S ribosomal protein L23 [Candidatus Portiera aleyrodidarum]|uniref:Large ribosomal subunit protein uL23 n=1 Tax=Candidatus Portiera aleyrodidarum TV TaxID=1297582 RepID=A0A8D3X8J1_9GAMM|nr:50S ribosomal protein L23 [Candidatus Portiera aleyrodidarum]AGI27126.1 ribosomal protein L23 [Candidatus Portiera aleyrodidarum TV]